MNRTKLSLLLAAAFAASAILGAIAPAQALASAPARWIGVYEPGAPQSVAPLTAVENEVGIHLGVTNFFRSIEEPFTNADLKTAVDNASKHGSIPLITLEICDENDSSDVSQSKYTLKKIAAGSLDSTLRKYADDTRDSGHEIWIRPFHEMNGYWYPWCGTTNTNAPGDFIPAWKHVHDIFAQEGATNVKFVWCPNIESLSKNSSGKVVRDADDSVNSIDKYYPGDAYVDYMALDGYNFSTTLDGVKWRPFTDLFAKPYGKLCSISTKPIFIAETASVSQGGNKPAWIADMFRVIPQSFPRLIGVSWYNSGNSRQDWPVDSSAAALQAFRLGVANGTFAPGLKLSSVHTSLSIKASATSVRRHHAFKLSGVLRPGQYHDIVRVDVAMPKHRASHRLVFTNSSAVWAMYYSASVRGVYHVRVSYAGDSNRLAGTSRWIRIVVK